MPTCFLAAIGNGMQFFTSQGVVLSGGKIATYLAGTSTPQATYTDSTGATPNANPIILSSDGRPTQEIWIPTGVKIKMVLEDSTGAAIPNGTYDNIVGINDISSSGISEWVPTGLTATYISATQFSVLGNQTALFPVKTPIKAVVTAGTIYGFASAASFGGGVTTVTVIWDITQLDNGLSAVSTSFLSASHLSVPYLREFLLFYSPERYGAIGDGVTDDTVAIQAALDAAGAFSVRFLHKSYSITSKLLVRKAGVKLFAEYEGMISSNACTITYNGASTADPMIEVQNGMHGVSIEGLRLNCNGLAGIAIQFDVNDLDSTHHPRLHSLYVMGYTAVGIVLGKNSTSVLGTGELDMPDLQRIYFGGGSAGTIGLLLNAQNAEWTHIKGLFFVAQDYAGNTHLNHIFAYGGGLNIQGLASTGASSYGVIVNGSQVHINGWRCEDRYAVKANAVGLEGPCVIKGLLARGSATLAGDLVVDFGASSTSTLELSGTVKGSVQIGNSAPLGIKADVMFTNGGDFVYPGPQQWFGYTRNLATGVTYMRGSEQITSDLSPSGNLAVTGNITTSGFLFLNAIQNNITAHAGGGQGSAVALTGETCRITVVGSSNDSCKLLSATGSGRTIFVRNAHATNAAAIFPQTGEVVNELAANAAYSLAAGSGTYFQDVAAGLWNTK